MSFRYLGVHTELFVRRTALSHGLHEHVYTLGFTSTAWAQCHHAVTNTLGFIQLVNKKNIVIRHHAYSTRMLGSLSRI